MSTTRQASIWNSGMMSSLSGEWTTPKQLFEVLDREFRFSWDLAATPDNKLAPCPGYDAFVVDWVQSCGGSVCWCNPPYGRKIGLWIEKAYRESGATGGPTIVMLLPARTDTQWFHEYVLHATEIRFIRGRLSFGENQRAGRAPFPSMIVVFRARKRS